MVQGGVRVPALFLNLIHSNMTNKYQIMSNMELSERMDCLNEIMHMLTRTYSHAFSEDDALIGEVKKERIRAQKELEYRGF
jgi:hypothetical protein